MPPKPIVIDTDIGDDVDDALALGYAAGAVRAGEVELLGATTVYGDTETRSLLAMRVLEAFGLPDVPVVTGEGKPLEAESVPVGTLNQRPVLEGWSPKRPPSRGAADFIIETVRSRPGEVTLVPIGALTNLALALRKDPEIARLVRGIVAMSGVFLEPRVEWNVKCDPEAFEQVVRSGSPVTLVGLDVTEKCKLSAEEVEGMRGAGAGGQLLVRMVELWGAYLRRSPAEPVLHDPLALGQALGSGFCRTERGSVKAELSGDSRGGTSFTPDPAGPVEVCTEVDAGRFTRDFVGRLQSP